MQRPKVSIFHAKMCIDPPLNPGEGFNGSFLVGTKQIVLHASNIDATFASQVSQVHNFKLDCDAIYINFFEATFGPFSGTLTKPHFFSPEIHFDEPLPQDLINTLMFGRNWFGYRDGYYKNYFYATDAEIICRAARPTAFPTFLQYVGVDKRELRIARTENRGALIIPTSNGNLSTFNANESSNEVIEIDEAGVYRQSLIPLKTCIQLLERYLRSEDTSSLRLL